VHHWAKGIEKHGDYVEKICTAAVWLSKLRIKLSVTFFFFTYQRFCPPVSHCYSFQYPRFIIVVQCYLVSLYKVKIRYFHTDYATIAWSSAHSDHNPEEHNLNFHYYRNLKPLKPKRGVQCTEVWL
jgi:hypothetical protein